MIRVERKLTVLKQYKCHNQRCFFGISIKMATCGG